MPVKDFFIPIVGKNEVKFNTPNTNQTRTIFYVNKNGNYEITDATILGDKSQSISTMTVQFTNNEVEMINSSVTNPFATNKKSNYSPPSILLKMPANGQTASWTCTEISGDVAECTAGWINITINGAQRKAIKVEKTYEGLNVKSISYYVKGIGLWKTEASEDGKTEIFDEFTGLSYDAGAGK